MTEAEEVEISSISLLIARKMSSKPAHLFTGSLWDEEATSQRQIVCVVYCDAVAELKDCIDGINTHLTILRLSQSRLQLTL